MSENVAPLLEAKRVRCTSPVPNRDYVVGSTYDIHAANHGGNRIEIWIGQKGVGGHIFKLEDAAQYFTPAS